MGSRVRRTRRRVFEAPPGLDDVAINVLASDSTWEACVLMVLRRPSPTDPNRENAVCTMKYLPDYDPARIVTELRELATEIERTLAERSPHAEG